MLAWPWKAPLLNWFEFGLVTLLVLLQTTTPSFQGTAKPADIASLNEGLGLGLLAFMALTTGIMWLNLIQPSV